MATVARCRFTCNLSRISYCWFQWNNQRTTEEETLNWDLQISAGEFYPDYGFMNQTFLSVKPASWWEVIWQLLVPSSGQKASLHLDLPFCYKRKQKEYESKYKVSVIQMCDRKRSRSEIRGEDGFSQRPLAGERNQRRTSESQVSVTKGRPKAMQVEQLLRVPRAPS